MASPRTLVDWLGLTALVLMWGSSFAVTKFAVGLVGPDWLVAIRLVLGALLMAGFAALTRTRLPRGPYEWAMVSTIGVVGTALPFIFISWSSQFVASGIAGLMMAANPFLVLVLSIFVLPEEKATPARVAGLLIGFAGVAMVIAGRADAPFAASSGGLLPYLALLAASAGYAVNAVAGRKAASIPPMTRAYGALLTAALGAVVIALVAEPLPTSLDAGAWFAIAWLAVVPTWGAAMVMFFLLDRTSAGFFAQTNYLVPAAAIAFGALIYAEQLHPLQYLGFAVTAAGIAVAEGLLGRVRRPPPIPPTL